MNPITIVKNNLKSIDKSDHLRRQVEITGTDLLKLNISDIPKFVDPVFPKVGLIAIGGSSDTGKSSLLRQLAVSTCTGADNFLGWKLNTETGSAIYVSTEDGMDATAYLLRRLSETHNLNPDDLGNLRFIFQSHDLVQHLEKSLQEKPADLVIIDAFTDLYAGALNEANRVRTFLSQYSDLAHRHNCLILFLHHTGKGKELEPPSKNHLIGSQAFEAKMRLVIELRADPEEENLRHLCIVKGNYLPSEFKQQSYVLEFNSDLSFSWTGTRQDFDTLVRTKTGDRLREKYEIAKNLRDDGKTYDEIKLEIGYRSKSSVSELFKRFESQDSFVGSNSLESKNKQTDDNKINDNG